MVLKKLVKGISMMAMAGAIVLSIGSGVALANNSRDTWASMYFDESSGVYLDYTVGRDKEDTTCGYIKGLSSSNGCSFNATLVGSDGDGSYNYYEDFYLIDYDVNPGDEIWMYNYVKENGYDGAAVRCESNTGSCYTVSFYWSPDSV